MRDNRSGIYKICLRGDSEKAYIGSTVNFRLRWLKHRSSLKAGRHHSQKLQHAWDKRGDGEFEFTILEVVGDCSDLIEREQFWIDEYKASTVGYNIRHIAESALGIKRSAETKSRMAIAATGRIHTDEDKKKMSESAKLRRASPETRAKLIASLKMRPPKSVETRAKIAATLTGKPKLEATKKKISNTLKGNVISEETREKISKALSGVKKPEGFGAKISAAKKGHAVSVETRAKISAALKSKGRANAQR